MAMENQSRALPGSDIVLTDAQFIEISEMVRRLAGINLHDGKKQLVKARLNKRLRILGMKDFRQYLTYLEKDSSGTELTTMLDVLSTNLTSFFRQPDQFDFLGKYLADRFRSGSRRLRIWCAGCSSGEEPYSVAISVRENAPSDAITDVRILATDLAGVMLTAARRGEYGPDQLSTVSQQRRKDFFEVVQTKPETRYRVSESLRRMITFARLNLMNPWPMKGPFDVIFCRNVMIYFDQPTSAELVERFAKIMTPGGLFFIGYAESLSCKAKQTRSFRYLRPNVYERV